MTLRAALLALALIFAIGGTAATPPARAGVVAVDWPTYGHDAGRSFHGVTALTRADLPALAPAWTFATGLAVTATPTVVHGTVYAGSWDGTFYALDLRSGRLRWKFVLDPQPAVSPHPSGPPDASSDGGMVTSSAWFEPGAHRRPDLVLFAGGFTLYALVARTGALYWKHIYSGRPDLPPDPVHDGTRIFSSPVVVDGNVVFGVSADGDRGRRGYIAAADLATGAPVWRFETDVDATGVVRNDGCGNVWSSGTLLGRAKVAVFAVADCHFSDHDPYDEHVVALRARDGRLVWSFAPPRRDDHCDFDFGATVNAGVDRSGRATFVGVGGKDGTYYSLDPATGRLRWSTNVVFGGFVGGFIATTAYDGSRVYGATALGDFGRFENNEPTVCDPSDPRDTAFQEPTVHSFDAQTGAVRWQDSGGASFGPTTVAGGMTFNCPALRANLDVRAASTGTLLRRIDLPQPCWSGVATAGDALVVGFGASFDTRGGIAVYTPGGRPPAATFMP